MIVINQIKLDINHTEEQLRNKVCKALQLNKDASFELIGLAWRTSSGLDWWVNDTWSIGIEVAQISQIWAQDVNDFTNQKFQILFRITHR